jgi:hypothetical protein
VDHNLNGLVIGWVKHGVYDNAEIIGISAFPFSRPSVMCSKPPLGWSGNGQGEEAKDDNHVAKF